MPRAVSELEVHLRTRLLNRSTRRLANGTLVRVLPDRTLHDMNIYALYPSRKFVDAKTRTWVEFLRLHLPEVIARDHALLAR